MDEFVDFFSIIFYFIFIVSLIVFPIAFKNIGKSKTKYSKLHKWSVISLVFGIVLMFAFGFAFLINRADRSSVGSSTPADGFTIEQYNVVLNVNESNVVDVKENIAINFYEEGHHGIYRVIPSWLEYTNKEGVTQSRESKISNLKAVEDEYSVETVDGKKRIKIGDPDYTLPVGMHNYEIHYTYDMGADPYENFDEFIFHAFGDYWGTEIKNASVTIALPKEFNYQDKIKFFADKYRNNDITSHVNYRVSDNVIYIDLSPNYKLYKSLTIDLELPEGYFVNESNTYGNTSLILCIVCIIFAIISFLMWIRNGKDLEKVPEITEFGPPEELDAAEIGYLYKKDTGKKLTIALIIELASKGFIKIIESDDDDNKKYTIVKSNTTDVSKSINREIKVVKLKDYKAPFLFDGHIDATKIMEDYFPDKVSENVVKSDFDSFYKNSKYLVDKGYIKIESDTIDKYSQEQLDEIQKELSLNEFKDKPKMSDNEKLVYDKLFEESDETVLSENHSFYNVFSEIEENVRDKFDDKINDLTSYKYMLITSIGFLICTFLWGVAFTIIEDLNPELNIIYLIAFVSNIVIFIFAILMKRKNSYGEEIKAKINGFKNYIQIAEKDKIDMMIQQKPNYFYEILPYAYILGVSKEWAKKLEKIPDPAIDMGNIDYSNIDIYDSLSDSVYVPSSSSSGSSGCSSCGGGCSSCGGGSSW